MSQKIGRNEPCPCGSGEKFKKCCLNKGEPSRPVQQLPVAQLAIRNSEIEKPTVDQLRASANCQIYVDVPGPTAEIARIEGGVRTVLAKADSLDLTALKAVVVTPYKTRKMMWRQHFGRTHVLHFGDVAIENRGEETRADMISWDFGKLCVVMIDSQWTSNLGNSPSLGNGLLMHELTHIDALPFCQTLPNHPWGAIIARTVWDEFNADYVAAKEYPDSERMEVP